MFPGTKGWFELANPSVIFLGHFFCLVHFSELFFLSPCFPRSRSARFVRHFAEHLGHFNPPITSHPSNGCRYFRPRVADKWALFINECRKNNLNFSPGVHFLLFTSSRVCLWMGVVYKWVSNGCL